MSLVDEAAGSAGLMGSASSAGSAGLMGSAGSGAITRRGLVGGIAGVLGLGAIVTLMGCAPGKPEPVPSDDDVKAVVTVRAIDNAFEPAEVEIAPDQAVRWVFEGSVEHDVVSDDRSFVSELMLEGEYTHHFSEEGEYSYICSVHPEMRGVVRVVSP